MQIEPKRQCYPLTTHFALTSAWSRYSRAHCRPLRTTPQMKSPQRSHHVWVVGPAGWKRWPRPGTGCLAGLRAVPGAMRSALARSSRVRPGPARRTGASSLSSMSSGSEDMARSAQAPAGSGLKVRARQAPMWRRPWIQAQRQERAEESSSVETRVPRLCRPAGGVRRRRQQRGNLAESPPSLPSLPSSPE